MAKQILNSGVTITRADNGYIVVIQKWEVDSKGNYTKDLGTRFVATSVYDVLGILVDQEV